MVYKRGINWYMDSTVNGIRYREALATTDRREAVALEKKRIGEIQQGKRASRRDASSLGCLLQLPQICSSKSASLTLLIAPSSLSGTCFHLYANSLAVGFSFAYVLRISRGTRGAVD